MSTGRPWTPRWSGLFPRHSSPGACAWRRSPRANRPSGPRWRHGRSRPGPCWTSTFQSLGPDHAQKVSLGSRTYTQGTSGQSTCPTARQRSPRQLAFERSTGTSAASATPAGSAGCSPAPPCCTHRRYAPARSWTFPPASSPSQTHCHVAENNQL